MVPRSDNRNRASAQEVTSELYGEGNDKHAGMADGLPKGMERFKLMKGLATVALLLETALSGCASDKRTNVSANLCAGLERFSNAHQDGAQRNALIFWPADDNPDAISFRAALQASPLDAAAQAFYATYAPSTHYITMEELGARFKTCLTGNSELRRAVRLEVSKAACGGTGSSQSCISITVDRSLSTKRGTP